MRFAVGKYPVAVNVTDQGDLLRELRHRLSQKIGFSLATLNLDHLVKLSTNATFGKAYAAQSFVTADGRPIVWLARLAGRKVDLVPGSELIRPLCQIASATETPIALLGSTDAALARAAEDLNRQYPKLRIVAKLSPSRNFDPDGAEADDLIQQLHQSGAGLCFLALGAPKQECFAARAFAELPEIGFASIGAGLDFIAGYQRRAPVLFRRLALEWFWRILENPRRMAPRYARCFAILPRLTVSALQSRLSANSAE